MAYSAMTKRSAGYVVPASEWNQLIDNDAYLKTQADTAQLIVKVLSDTNAVTTGDGKMNLTIPAWINGWNLTDYDMCLYTVSSSGAITWQLRNVTDSHDMLSTACTIDQSEYSSYTAATATVIDANYDDVATGDRLAFDCDGAGTGAQGAEAHVKFQAT
jgi:hypothetical protein